MRKLLLKKVIGWEVVELGFGNDLALFGMFKIVEVYCLLVFLVYLVGVYKGYELNYKLIKC